MADVPKPNNLDWVQLKLDIGQTESDEPPLNRLFRKCRENPLVPIGATVTVGALSYGIYNMYNGTKEMQQKMMRLRVGAQLFTILAAVGGIILTLPKDKRNLRDFIKSGDPQSRQQQK